MQNDTQQKQSSQPKGNGHTTSPSGRATSAYTSGRTSSSDTSRRTPSSNVSGRAPMGNTARSGQTGHAVEGATYRKRNTAGASSVRPSGFATTPSARESTTHSTKSAQRHAQMKRKPYNKRRRRKPFPWKPVLIGLGAALVIALIIVLIVNASRGTHHMLPTVRRIDDYTPEPYSPEATTDAGLEQGAVQEHGDAGNTLPEGDASSEAADFSAEPDIPVQDIGTADTIAWYNAATGVNPPCPPCEGGLLGFRPCEGGLLGVRPCERVLMGPGAASIYDPALLTTPREIGSGLCAAYIYRHPYPASLRNGSWGTLLTTEIKRNTRLPSHRMYRKAVEA